MIILTCISEGKEFRVSAQFRTEHADVELAAILKSIESEQPELLDKAIRILINRDMEVSE